MTAHLRRGKCRRGPNPGGGSTANLLVPICIPKNIRRKASRKWRIHVLVIPTSAHNTQSMTTDAAGPLRKSENSIRNQNRLSLLGINREHGSSGDRNEQYTKQ